MAVTGVTLQVLPGYQLRLFFPNGSEAVINMKQRVRAIRGLGGCHRWNCFRRPIW